MCGKLNHSPIGQLLYHRLTAAGGAPPRWLPDAPVVHVNL